MAVNFPNNPSVNDTFVVDATVYTFDGEKWVVTPQKIKFAANKSIAFNLVFN